MRTRIFFILSFAILIGCKTPQNSASRDEALAAKLVGTWINAAANNQPFNSETTYKADGTGLEYVWPKGQPKETAVQVETRWMVKDGVLSILSIHSSNERKIPAGIALKDKILSMSKDQFIYEPLEGYSGPTPKKVIKLRK